MEERCGEEARKEVRVQDMDVRGVRPAGFQMVPEILRDGREPIHRPLPSCGVHGMEAGSLGRQGHLEGKEDQLRTKVSSPKLARAIPRLARKIDLTHRSFFPRPRASPALASPDAG